MRSSTHFKRRVRRSSELEGDLSKKARIAYRKISDTARDRDSTNVSKRI